MILVVCCPGNALPGLPSSCWLPAHATHSGKGTDHIRQQSAASVPASRTLAGAKPDIVQEAWEGAGVAVQTEASEPWALFGAAWNLRPLAKCVNLTPCLDHWGLPT